MCRQQLGEPRVDLDGVESILLAHAPDDGARHRSGTRPDFEDARGGSFAAQAARQLAGQEAARRQDRAGVVEVAAEFAKEVAAVRPDAHCPVPRTGSASKANVT